MPRCKTYKKAAGYQTGKQERKNMLNKETTSKVKEIAKELKPLFVEAKKLKAICKNLHLELMPKKEKLETDTRNAFSIGNWRNVKDQLDAAENEINMLSERLTVAEKNYKTQLEIIELTAAKALMPLFNQLYDRRGYETCGEIIRAETDGESGESDRLFLYVYSHSATPTLTITIYSNYVKPKEIEFSDGTMPKYNDPRFITVSDFRKAKEISRNAYESVKKLKAEATQRILDTGCYEIVNLDYQGR